MDVHAALKLLKVSREIISKSIRCEFARNKICMYVWNVHISSTKRTNVERKERESESEIIRTICETICLRYDATKGMQFRRRGTLERSSSK